MQRWSNHMVDTLRTLMRRGALFLLAAVAAVVVTVSPLATRPASAAITDFGLGGNSCAIETIGWVVCPTMRTIARLADKGFTYINKETLKINFSLFDTSSRTYQAWEIMRNIANGLFVIVFLYMIYSYLIGKVNGSYSLKRLLPRLLIAAILINVSFYIGVIMVDLTNIIGSAVWEIMKGVYGSGSQVMPIDKPPSPTVDGNLTKLTASAMGNTALVWVLLPLILAVVLTIAVISGVMVILIIMRQAIIAMIILAAPILIVLYLLPNLEKYAGQAMRIFIQLLLLFPIIAVLLGTGQIVSMAATSWSTSAFYGGGTMNITPDIVGAGVAVLPLLGLWFIYKNMSSFMSSAGSRLSASIQSRRGGDEKAQVTGKATLGAAKMKLPTGVGNGIPNRRQAFTRNRRRASLGGSALGDDDSRAGMANRKSPALPADGLTGTTPDPEAFEPQSILSETSTFNNSESSETKEREEKETNEKRLEELNNNNSSSTDTNTEIKEQDEKLGMGDGITQAVLGAKGREGDKEEKSVTAKDLFNNLNRSHESKDKDRKFGAGPGITGGGGGGGTVASGTAQPSAPGMSYRAPEMAQGGIVSGASAGQTPVQIVAVPVQVDASSLLGQSNHPLSSGPPENVTQPPISGTEEKAKARAQKYLFDADQELEDARNKEDILGHKDKDTPVDEQPHVMANHDKDSDE